MQKKSGLSICSGGLFGLGESWQDRIDLALACQQLEIKSIPLNFLNPIEGTPLSNAKKILPQDILRTIAIFRIYLPDAHIRICGGREYGLRDLQSHLFRAGANGMMIGNYLTVSGRNAKDDYQMLQDLNLEVSS